MSLVITAWNAERFLGQAVRSALDQTEPPGEIVVVDDGSTDGTADLAASLDPLVRVVRRAHEGVGAARTAGVAETTGSLVAFLDADDVWFPQKLERQVAVLLAEPAVEAVFCLMDEFVDGETTGMRAPRQGAAAPLSGAALVRRELVARVGPFPAGSVGDWAGWWARARSLGVREHVVPEVLFRRRIHGSNNSSRRYDDGRTFLAIAREHLRSRSKN